MEGTAREAPYDWQKLMLIAGKNRALIDTPWHRVLRTASNPAGF